MSKKLTLIEIAIRRRIANARRKRQAAKALQWLPNTHSPYRETSGATARAK